MARKRGVATQKGMEGIAERVSRIRRERGLTQQEVARSLGVAQPIVSLYERGQLRLHGELLARFAEILGVSADEILGLKPPKSAPAPRPRRAMRRFEKLQRLTQGEQKAVLRFVNALLKVREHGPRNGR